MLREGFASIVEISFSWIIDPVFGFDCSQIILAALYVNTWVFYYTF
jgi:hypothetical protein